MQQDIPRWYHLFWDEKKKGLFIKIHRFFLTHCEHKNFEPYFVDIESRLDFLPLFDSYVSVIGRERFGVNDSIVFVDGDSEWFTYRIKLPLVIHKTGMVCSHCEGKGDSEFGRGICSYCEGEKTESFYVYREISEVCFSLQILLNALAYPIDRDVPTPLMQLFTMTSCCSQQSQGHSVGGYASPELVRFLHSFSTSWEVQVELPTLIGAMKEAHRLMHGKLKAYYDQSFFAFTRGGQFIISCPGNACEIHTEASQTVRDGHGDGITCHNLDSAIQQLTLLAGMGALTSLYDGKK
jgi:hypothetical protein